MLTKVQTHCITLAIKRADITLAVKLALMANVEGGNYVYLDNAKSDVSKHGVSAHQFAGALSVLTAQGYYKQIDGYFGEINH